MMGKHKNVSQDTVLLKFMESHPDFARGFIKSDRVTMEACWSELAEQLNEKGPPVKDIMAWKKVWNDWKAVIRKKLATNKAESVATRGDPFVKQTLTKTEETIARISGIYSEIRGPIERGTIIIKKSRSFSLTSEPAETRETVDFLESSDEEEAQCAPTPKRKRVSSESSSEIDCLQLITKKVENIAYTAEEMVNVLKKRNDEIRRHNLAMEQHNADILQSKRRKNEIMLKELELKKLQLDLALKFRCECHPHSL